jgi:hypothetical protein
MASRREEMTAVAHAHAAAEANNDLAGTLGTLDDEPVYELQPLGRAFRGMEATRIYYEHFFNVFSPLIVGYALRDEWISDEGIAQEYTLDVHQPEGGDKRYPILGVLLFGERGLAGERLWAPEELLRVMLGPAFALATPR